MIREWDQIESPRDPESFEPLFHTRSDPDLDLDRAYAQEAMTAEQADQRAQQEHDEELKRILSNVWTWACCNTPIGQGLTTDDFKLLCQATGVAIRDVT